MMKRVAKSGFFFFSLCRPHLHKGKGWPTMKDI